MLPSDSGTACRGLVLRTIVLPALLLLAGAGPTAMGQTGAAQEFRVLSADASGMTVEYRPVVSMHAGPGGTVYDFAGALSGDAESIGAPDLRFRSALLALPGVQGHTVSVLQADYRDEAGVRIAPLPDFRDTADTRIYRYATGPAYSGSGFLPAAPAALVNVGLARDRIVGELRISPVQWDPARSVARVYARLLVRVDFGPAAAGLAPSREPLMVRVVNPAQAAAWGYRHPAPLRRAVPQSMASGDWYRIEITERGLYRLDKSWFEKAHIDVSTVDPRTIRIFGSGGRELPADIGAPRPDDMQEIAIEVRGGEDGRFDDQDEVIFYGEGLTGFAYNRDRNRYDHYIHRYDRVNAYLLTFGGAPGRRVETLASIDDPAAPEVPWFEGLDAINEEQFNFVSSGKLWVGPRLLPSAGGASSAVYNRRLAGLVRTEPVVYRCEVYSSSEVSNWFTLRANDQDLGRIDMPTVDFGTDRADIAGTSGRREYTGTGALDDDRSIFTATYGATSTDRSRGGNVDWIEWHYARRFEPVGDELRFSAPDSSSVYRFTLNGFSSSDVRLYDVSDPFAPRSVTGTATSGGTVRFGAASVKGAPAQFFAAAVAAVRSPGAPVRVANSSLHDAAGAEHVIITTDALLPSAERLRAHRARAGENHLSSTVVSLQAIYNEFNGGVQDPTAIRNFLAYAFDHWSVQPRHVLLLGDGHYDYLNHESTEQTVVPVWESDNSITLIATYPTDDYFGLIAGVGGNDRRVDLCIGRIPAKTEQEASTVVDKIVRYETGEDFNPWRNRVTFVADDDMTNAGPTDGRQHTEQSETIAASIPQTFEQKKVYIVSYRTENTPQGRRKPDAAAAIVEQFNLGTLAMNWTGHGAHDVWAHERVFLSDVTIPQLNNAARLSFVTAATCTFGLYDRPGVTSGTEGLLLRAEGGSIGGLSSPRVVYSTENSAFNQAFYENLLTRGRDVTGRVKTVGEAVFATKQDYFSSVGYEKFHLFADPGLRLAMPRYSARVDRILINGQPASGDTVQLSALARVTLEGSVRRADSSLWNDFEGVLDVSLFDAERRVLVNEWNWSYTQPGGLLYRGQAGIKNGRFTVSFIVPKDISYDNAAGRIAMYFTDGATDGAGFTSGIRVGGTDTSAVADDRGPDIALFLDTRTFRTGDMTGESPRLLADLFDESGINTTGLGIGHDIEAWVDDAPTGIVLNDSYTGEIDSYQRGTVEHPFAGLANGAHTLRLRAWDIHNNSTTVETAFVVASSDQLTIENLLPYPNPMTDGTTFTFQHNLSDPVNVEVRIYTVAGRLVRMLEARDITERYVQLPWDGRDADGDAMANGVYLYKLTCSTVSGDRGSESTGRISILR